MKTYTNKLIFLLLLSAFGPYLSISLGLKIDSVVIFLGGLLYFLFILSKKTIIMHKNVRTLSLIWLTLFLYLFFRTLIFGGSISTSSFVAEIKNFLQPLFLITIFAFVIDKQDGFKMEDILSKAGKWLILFLSLNTLWIFLGFFIDLTAINQYFWKGSDSVAHKAAEMGRFSGIFNQPVESGVSYSVGIFAWTYLMDLSKNKLKFINIVSLILLIIGGSLSVSKVFVVFGLGIFVIYAFSVKTIRSQLLKLAISFAAIFIPIYMYLTNTWEGLKYLLRLFDSSNYQQQGVLTLLTAGRYGGEESQQSMYFDRIMNDAPIFGKGLGSQDVYDSAFFHMLSSGGLLALGLYILLLCTLVWGVYQFYFYAKKRPEFKFFACLVLLVMIGGLGAPVLTLNRASVILWVFIGLSLQFLSIHVKERKLEFQKNNIKINNTQLEYTAR